MIKNVHFLSLFIFTFLVISTAQSAVTATITGASSVCSGSPSPALTLSCFGASSPYTFTYTVFNGTITTTTTTTSSTSSTATLLAPTSVGVYTYKITKVKGVLLASQPSFDFAVNTLPEAILNSTVYLSTINGLPGYRFCSGETIEFYNASTTSNSLYEINWGDGSADYSSPALGTIAHAYTPGLYTLTHTVTGDLGCKKITTYPIFVGQSPQILFSSAGNTSGICSGSSLVFDISGAGSNPSTTTYTVTFNDGTAPLTYTQATLPAHITHTFNLSSCGYTSVTATGSYQNSFSATIVAENTCNSSAVTVAPIYVSSPPNSNFTVPSIVSCSNTPLCFTNTSTGNQVTGPNPATCTLPRYVWKIVPSTGVTLSAGSSYGIDNSNNTPSSWTSGSNVFCPKFSIPGQYTISLRVGNNCSIDQKDTVITVENGLLPQFTVNTNEGCTPLAVTTINTTDLSNSTVPIYQWVVSYVAGNCGSGVPVWNNTGGTTLNSANPSFNFVTPGTYTLKLSTLNSCVAATPAQRTIIVKKPPTVSINAISNSCGSINVHPVAVIDGCAPVSSVLSYIWSFPGGTPASANSLDPGVISYNSIGNYTASLTVTNECGSTVANSNTFYVNEVPVVNAVSNQVKCSGDMSTSINFSGSGGPVYQWTNSNTSIGLAATGVGSIPSFTLQNSGNTILIATITVTPKIIATGCTGTPITFTITVNPTAKLNQPASQILSNGNNTSAVLFSNPNLGGVSSYQWINSNTSTGLSASGNGDINSFTAINSSTAPITSIITVTPSFDNGGVGCIGTTKEFQITVNPSAQVNTPTNVSVCNGKNSSPVVFTTFNTGGNATYSWVNDTPSIGLAASGIGNVSVFTAINTGVVPIVATITVTPSYFNSGSTNVGSPVQFTITVDPAPIISSQPLSSTVCVGGSPIPLAVSIQGGVGVPNYQWYSNSTSSTSGGVGIGGATSSIYNPPSTVAGTTYYYCRVTMSLGSCPLLTSDVVSVSIVEPAIITSQPTGTQTICVGGSITAPFTVGFSGGLGVASFRWYKNSIPSNLGGELIVGEITANFMPSVFGVVGHYYYYAEVILSGSGCGSVFSNVADVNVVADPVVSTPAIALQTLCQGSTPVNLNIAVTGGIGTYTYQWYENTVENISTGIAVFGAQSSSFTPPTNSIGTMYYYCVVSQSGVGCGVVSAISKVVINAIPIITTQPLGSTVCVGEIPSPLTVQSQGGVGLPIYRWYSNTVNSTIGATLLPLAVSDTYLPSAIIAGTLYYYCEISYATGGCSNVVSDVASVIVKPNPVIGTKNSSICSGMAFEVTPDNLSGDIVPVGTTFTWSVPFISPLGAVTGASAQAVPQHSISQLLTNTTTSLATVSYIVTPIVAGCVGADFTVVVQVIPTIIPNAVINNSRCFGAKNGSILTNIVGGLPFGGGSAYTTSWTGPNGFTANSPSISELESGDYSLTILDAGNCPVISNYTVAEPTVISINTILKKDISCFGAANGKVDISVTGGTSPYAYSWTKNGNAYSTTEDLDNLSSGVYEVSVSDSHTCSFTKASFIVVEPTVLTVNLANQTDIKCFGSATGALQVDVQGGVKSEITAAVFDYHYAWTGPNGYISNSKNIGSLFSGLYHLIVTDENGCVQNLTATVHQADELVLNTTSTPISSVGNDGTISLVISGGVSPYDVQWSNLGSGLVQTDLSPGNYTITVTDANNCQKAVTIILMDATFSIHPVVKNVLCNGTKTGSINLHINGGTPPLKIVWTDNLTAGSVRNGLGAGTYTMTLSDATLNKITQSFVIVEPQALVVTGSVNNAFDCSNPNSGSIDLTVFGGTQPYSYAWSNGGDTEDLVGIPMGAYSVIVTDAKGCEKSLQYEVLRQNPIVISFSSVDHFSCDTKRDSKIYTAQVSGGVPPYQLSWSSGSVSGVNHEMMESSQDGIVTLLIKDASGCTSSSSFSVSIPVIPIPTISFSTQPTPLQTLCVGGSIPSLLSIVYTGGSGVASYKWFVNTVNSTVGGLEIVGANQSSYLPSAFSSVGTSYFYAELSLTGERCCPLFSNTARVNVVANPTVNLQPLMTQTVCQGGDAQELKVGVTGGVGAYSYQWYVNSINSNSGGLLISGATNSAFTPQTSSLGTKYYYCEISQEGAGCGISSNPAALIVNAVPSFTTQPSSSTLCLGDLPVQLGVGYKDGVGLPSYRWYASSVNSVVGGALIPGAIGSNYVPSVATVGTTYYYCILSFSTGNCSVIVSDIACVIVNPRPVISSQVITLCSDESFKLIPSEIVGSIVPVGTTYTWSTPIVVPGGSIVGASAQAVAQSEISQTLSNSSNELATATYTVIPTSNGCNGTPFSIVVTVVPKIMPHAIVQNVSCFGARNGSIKTNITPSAPMDAYQIQWSGPNGFSATTRDVSGLALGEYDLLISYEGTCSFTNSYVVTEPSEMLVSILSKNDVSCNALHDAKIEVSVTGGTSPYIYSWAKEGQVFATNPNVSNLGVGVYALVVKDANGCSSNTSYTITEPTPLKVTLLNKTDLLCFGSSTGALEIEVQGGTSVGISDYLYAWVGPNGFKSSLKNLSQLSAGDYTLTVTDKNECSQTLSVSITTPEELKLSIATTPITCVGASNASATLIIKGGKAPYQIGWSNLGSGLVQSNLAPGDYSVMVTDGNACQKSISINIPEANFILSPKVKDISCNGAHDGSIRLNASGGVAPVTVSWSDDATAGGVRNNLSVGTYTVVVSDASPCQITKSFTVVEPQVLSLSAVVANAVDCADKNSGSINLSVTGGTTPYTYAWSNGSSTEDIPNLAPGNYSVIVTDKNGCQKTAQYEVIRPLAMSISVSSIDVFSIDTKKVVKIFTADVSGGVPPYQLKWSDGAVRGSNHEIMETSVNGIVIVEATDAAGCVANLSINVTIPLVKEPYVRIDYHIIDCEQSTYQFSGIVTGSGAQDASFDWDFGDGQHSTIKNTTHSYATPGLYRVRLTMSSVMGISICEAKVQVEALPVLLLDKEAMLCEGGTVVVHASGAHNYLWSDGSVADSMIVKQKDNYTLIGTSKSGCSKTLNFSSRYFDASNYNIYTDKDEITTDSVTLHLWSDTMPYAQYFWDFGDGLKGQGNDAFHTYNVVSQEYIDVKLQVIGPDGCITNALKRIAVKIASPPNVFTPNGDGVNDLFMGNWDNLAVNRVGGNSSGTNGEATGNTIKSLDDLLMKVYNRNGILMYSGKNGWDGNYNGKPVSEDTYFYVLYYPTSTGVRTKTGFITVVK